MLHRTPWPMPFAVAALSTSFACGVGSPSDDARTAATISIAPSSITVRAGHARPLVAAVFDSAGLLVRDPAIEWSTSDPAIAVVDGNGSLTGIAPGTVQVVATAGPARVTAGATVAAELSWANADIVLDRAITHQEFHGWEVKAWIGEWACPPGGNFDMPVLRRYRDAVLDSAVSFGITRLRLEVRPSAERRDDPFERFRAGRIDYRGYREFFYDAVNDNDDPFLIDRDGFHFSELDFAVDEVVEPLRRRILRAGEVPYINLDFVDFRRDSEFEHRADAEEYAEFILATFLHLQSRYGWVPDAVEMILEPDNGTDFTGLEIGRALVATAQRLESAGFRPDFTAPSTKAMDAAVPFLDEMMAVPGVRRWLTEFAYHRYGGVSDANLAAIGRRAQQYGLRSAMLEKIGSDYTDLHADLTAGRNSAWQQYALAGCADGDPGGRHLLVDASDPLHPAVTIASRTRFLLQYFRYIRPGAVRIEARSRSRSFDPVAFINRDGRAVVVVKADGPGEFTIGGLPPGRYGVSYTTGPDPHTPLRAGVIVDDVVVVTEDEPATFLMPGRGVITVFGR